MKEATIRVMFAGDDIATDLDGDFMIYVVVDPAEDAADSNILYVSLGLDDVHNWITANGYTLVRMDEVYEYRDGKWQYKERT